MAAWTQQELILPGVDESPIDILEREGRNYYFQFTLNDYDAEKLEPNVPKLEAHDTAALAN